MMVSLTHEGTSRTTHVWEHVTRTTTASTSPTTPCVGVSEDSDPRRQLPRAQGLQPLRPCKEDNEGDSGKEDVAGHEFEKVGSFLGDDAAAGLPCRCFAFRVFGFEVIGKVACGGRALIERWVVGWWWLTGAGIDTVHQPTVPEWLAERF